MKEINELVKIRELTQNKDDLIQYEELGRINYRGNSYPIIGFVIGTRNPLAPCLALVGGVHGLERVGTHVVLAYLSTMFKQLKWDNDLREMLKHSRIVSIPLINPAGMANFMRSNPQGVDLMRNAPCADDVEGEWPLVSGHRLSNLLPWYSGRRGEMEIESLALVNFIRQNCFESTCAVSVDFHSGFGMRDRLWFPYGRTKEAFPRMREMQNLKELLDDTLPHHVYKIEGQSESYIIKGDLWDYLFDEHYLGKDQKSKIYLPLTLEMGSWNWVRKNPIQVFSADGLFNPTKGHRYARTMRRHFLLLDFLFRAVRHKEAWY